MKRAEADRAGPTRRGAGAGAPEARRPARAAGAVLRVSAALVLALGVAPAVPAASETEPAGGPVLELESITYVASRASRREMVLDAARARLRPEQRIVHLREVRAQIPGAARTEGVDVTCDRGTFDLATNGFVAEGNVHGRTGDGRRFRTARLRYDPEARLVTTDSSVVIHDATGTYQGGGFRYHVDEARFQLLGGATVVQEP